MRISQHTPVANNHRLLNGMLQLTDIAIPRMLLLLQLGSLGKGKRSLVVLLGKTLYEEVC